MEQLLLSGNGRFSAAGGYPIELSPAGETVVDFGVIPPGVTSVTVELACEPSLATPTATATATLTAHDMPTTVGGEDGPASLDLNGDPVTVSAQIGVKRSSLTLAIPSGPSIEPVPHIVRLVISDVTGRRDGREPTIETPTYETLDRLEISTYAASSIAGSTMVTGGAGAAFDPSWVGKLFEPGWPGSPWRAKILAVTSASQMTIDRVAPRDHTGPFWVCTRGTVTGAPQLCIDQRIPTSVYLHAARVQ